MVKIINNPDEYIYNAVTDTIEANHGYCMTNLEAKCMCDKFKQQYCDGKPGMCDCGRYIIVTIKEN